jgi:putative ABC transport system permease protein
LPAVLAVSFSAVLIALQCGLLLGLFSVTSIPIDRSPADVWVASEHVQSVDLGKPVPHWYHNHLASQPEVKRVEHYLQGFAYWKKPSGESELCMVIGSRLDEDALGNIADLSPEVRAELARPQTVVVDRSDLERLGIEGVGNKVTIAETEVRVVGVVEGLPSLAGPYVLCSIRTARPLLHMMPDQTTYLLAECFDPGQAAPLVERLQQRDGMTAYTRDDFSWKTRLHWLTTTKGGIALGYVALLGLLVGGIVTSQTLYAATVAEREQHAVLLALGIPRLRIARMVVAKSFWIGVIGIAMAVPVIFALASLAYTLGVWVHLPYWLLAAAAAITLGMALLAGLVALRSLRTIDPFLLFK